MPPLPAVATAAAAARKLQEETSVPGAPAAAPLASALADTSLSGLPVLGQGRFGRVYLSKLETGQPCAVKVVATPAALAEIECMQAVGNHRGVVQLLDHHHGDLDASLMLLMLEYCDGGSLSGKCFRGEDLANVTRQLMLALQHVHTCGYIHRDVKPDNILVRYHMRDCCLKLADFGCAARVGHCVVAAGTKCLMAPELLLLGEAPCYKCDLWSAAYTLYAIVSGDLPSSCLDRVENGFPAAPALGQNIVFEGERFCDFMIALLQEHRGDRMSSAQALAHPYLAR